MKRNAAYDAPRGFDTPARRSRGLTQEQLAEHTGVSRAAIARFEAGEIEPSLRTLVALADALQLTTDELPGRDAPQTAMLFPAAWEALQTLIREITSLPPPET